MIKHRGDTIGILGVFTNKDGDLVNPSGHTIKVFNPSGTKKDEDSNPTNIGLGVFEYYYDIPTDAEYGDWIVTWRGVSGAYVEREPLIFTVVKLEGD